MLKVLALKNEFEKRKVRGENNIFENCEKINSSGKQFFTLQIFNN